MAFCGQCGTQIQDDARFCPVCGTVQGQQTAAQSAPPEQSQQGSYQQYQQQAYQQPYQQAYQQPVQPERTYEPDGDPHTLAVGAITMFSYWTILFWIPLVAAKNSRFARFHAGQGLNLLLAGIAYSIATGILTGIAMAISFGFGAVLSTLFGLAGIAFFVLFIMGIINVCKGEMKPLPIIGNIKILKM